MVEPTDLYFHAPTFHHTDAGYILPNGSVLPNTSRMVSFVTPYPSRPLADYSFAPGPAEHSCLHDQQLSHLALAGNRIVHAPCLTHEQCSTLAVALASSPAISKARNFQMPPTSTTSTTAQLQHPDLEKNKPKYHTRLWRFPQVIKNRSSLSI